MLLLFLLLLLLLYCCLLVAVVAVAAAAATAIAAIGVAVGNTKMGYLNTSMRIGFDDHCLFLLLDVVAAAVEFY